MSARLISKNACQDVLAAEFVVVPGSTVRTQSDKPDWFVGLAGVLVVATVIVLSVYSIVRYLT